MKFKPSNINPQGRPKVYFCSHPSDFEKYFESISDEILKKQKCTIWYSEKTIVRDENFFADIKQMQLFVMPVTTTLLCTDNFALNVEFKLAIENHIPVLPLMQESGLEELFNQKCGNLQFLDKHNTDTTAISYNNKLEKYLSSVLIGDELAEKIRATFDAYIFLSYRKKDRSHAQKLMHLIHKNSFCRDIAIWYDEFLIPGENFNDSIKKAIQKSGLFVLTVTPNLVSEVNYVMTEEYPMAQRESKVILPAEMVETNKTDLILSYENIPECVNAENDADFSEALFCSIQRIALTKNDKSPEHNFFIGLAYLNGIDVEIDTEKALNLIESSANEGLIDACEQLVLMYRIGKGVPINYVKAIDYQKKKICHLKDDYTNNEKENCDVLFWELLNLCDYYREIGDIKSAKSALLDAKNYLHNNSNSINIKRKEAGFYERVGVLYMSEGFFEQAKKCFEIYHNKLVEVCDVEPTDDKINEVLISFCRIGDIMFENGKMEDALKHYNKLLFAEEQLNLFERADDFRQSIYAKVLSRISHIISNEKGETKQAKKLIEKALMIDYAIAEDTVESQRSLAIDNLRMGEICIAEGKSLDALSWYDKAGSIMEKLVKKSQNQLFINDLVLIYTKIGDIYKNEEKYSEALEIYEKAVELIRNAYEIYPSSESKTSLAHSLSKIGDIMLLLAIKDNETMPTNDNIHLEKKKIDDGLTITDLVFDISNIGLIRLFFKRKKHLETSVKYYDEAINLFEELKDELETVKSKRCLKTCYNNVSMLFNFVGDVKIAQKYSIQALELASNIAEETTNNADIDELALAFLNYAKLSKDIQCYKSAFEIWDFLCNECPNVEKYKINRNMVRKMIEKFV